MDPKLIEQAAAYLAALLGEPAAQLHQLALNLLNAQLLQWQGANSFTLNRDSPALVSMCPALLSNETLSKIGTPDGHRVLRTRLLADPDIAAIDVPGSLSGGVFDMSPGEMADMSRQIDQSLAAGLPNGVAAPEGETAQQRWARLQQGEANRRARTRANVAQLNENILTDFQRRGFGGGNEAA